MNSERSSNLIVPVILCGGSGTRLWPRSRVSAPKPFLPLVGERTLFQQALDRCGDTAIFAAPLIVSGAAHVPHIEAQIGNGAAGLQLIVEPAARSTAPAIALAAARLPRDAVMLVCPSDHYIADTDAFVTAAQAAAQLASEGHMTAFGITPDRPETGYGYIKAGAQIAGGRAVDRFVEKPDLATAEGFLASGEYGWNGGIFAFQAGAFLDELARHRPDMAAAVARSVDGGTEADGIFHPEPAAFNEISGDSVDYAIMENTAHAAMVPARMGWSDIGNWRALHQARPSDSAGNSVTGEAELVDCANVLVQSDGPRVSAIGLEDLVIVVDGDEVLVTTADGAQKVGKLCGALNQKGGGQ